LHYDFAFEWREYKIGRIRNQGERKKKKKGRIRDLRRFGRLAGGHKDPSERTIAKKKQRGRLSKFWNTDPRASISFFPSTKPTIRGSPKILVKGPLVVRKLIIRNFPWLAV
jgi:hypothetical protein